VSVLVLTGSARRDSYTRRLGEALAAGLPAACSRPRLTELPYFDQDLEAHRRPRSRRCARRCATRTPSWSSRPSTTAPSPACSATPSTGSPGRTAPAPARQARRRGRRLPGEVGGARAVVSLRTLLGNTGAEVLGRPITVGGVARLLDAGALDDVVDQVAAARRRPHGCPRGLTRPQRTTTADAPSARTGRRGLTSTTPLEPCTGRPRTNGPGGGVRSPAQLVLLQQPAGDDRLLDLGRASPMSRNGASRMRRSISYSLE
jgi:hypothetical protein